MTLVGQIFVVSVSIICFLLRYYFKNISKKKSGAERKKFELISVCMTGATVIGLLCTFFLILDELMITGQEGAVFFKMFAVGLIICEIINYKNDELRDGMAQFVAIAVPILISVVGLMIGAGVYESNVDKAEDKKYSQEQFELVDIFDDTKSDVSVNVQTSISKYFKYEVEEVAVSQSSEEEKETTEKKQTYEICYFDKSEPKQQLYKTIGFYDTSLKPVPEGQKPYMIVKTYTSYSINNNVDPPEECDFEDSYKYELYVPKEDIEELSNLLK